MMKRKTNKRIVIAISSIAILLMTVGGVLAYLTDTASVTNTFTVGDVKITLDEAKVTPEGKPVDGNGNEVDLENAERVTDIGDGTANNYHLIPGMTYVKDPTMTVKSGSDESYVRMLVTINCASAFDAIYQPEKADLTKIFNEYSSDWVYVDATRVEDEIIYEFRYKETVSGYSDDENKTKADMKLPPLFKSITVPEFLTKEQLMTLENLVIKVEGHAIQAAGFEKENDAWAAFDKQVNR